MTDPTWPRQTGIPIKLSLVKSAGAPVGTGVRGPSGTRSRSTSLGQGLKPAGARWDFIPPLELRDLCSPSWAPQRTPTWSRGQYSVYFLC